MSALKSSRKVPSKGILVAEKIGVDRPGLARAEGIVPRQPTTIAAMITGPTPKIRASLEETAIPANAPSPPMKKIVPITNTVYPSCCTKKRMRIANVTLLKKFDVAVEPAIDRRRLSFKTTASPSFRSFHTLAVEGLITSSCLILEITDADAM